MSKEERDFIKWLCEKAQKAGWSNDYDTIAVSFEQKLSNGKDFHIGINIDNALPQFEILYYPLLLQRACEYFMTSHPSESIWFILQDCEEIKAYRFYGDDYDRSLDKCFEYSLYDSVDKAKEAALKYIYEQEKKG